MAEESGARRGMRPARVLILAAGMACALAGLFWLANYGVGAVPLRCVLHEVTGLHCPGCGMTRATHAALQGDFPRAFRFNPLGVILLPIALLALVPSVWRWVYGKPPLPERRWGRLGTLLAVVVIAFGVLRNLPWKPFLWLAPPEASRSAAEELGHVFGEQIRFKVHAVSSLAGGKIGGLVGVRDDPEARQGVLQ